MGIGQPNLVRNLRAKCLSGCLDSCRCCMSVWKLHDSISFLMDRHRKNILKDTHDRYETTTRHSSGQIEGYTCMGIDKIGVPSTHRHVLRHTYTDEYRLTRANKQTNRRTQNLIVRRPTSDIPVMFV